jgi:nicotinate-nucleotide pyrophosphorylase (carboxylating)
VKEAVKHPIHIIMLDNMTIEEMREASKIIRTTNIKIEVSGGVSLENIATFKGLDVDFISSGSLTHSINAVDISAKILI